MCYAKPGPRCHTHAKADLVAAEERFEAGKNRQKKIDSDITYYANKHNQLARQGGVPEDTLNHYYGQVQAHIHASDEQKIKVDALKKKVEEERLEANATKAGLSILEDRIAEIESRGYGAEFEKEEYRVAKETYDARMEKYDEKFQTVDGRKPSRYGNDEGIDKLRGEIKKTEKKLKDLHEDELINNVDHTEKIARVKETQRRLKAQLRHAYATDRHKRNNIISDPERAAELRQKAADLDKQAADSFERSDTDGFMSQWASGISADKSRMEAELAENGGKAEFNALFDKDGNMVPAKQVQVADKFRPGSTKSVWVVLSDPNDPDSPVKEWVNESSSSNMKTQEAYLAKKGYSMGTVRVPAYVATRGEQLTSVRNVFVRKDRGFSPDAEVVTTNRYPELIERYKNHDKTQAQIDYEAEQEASAKK